MKKLSVTLALILCLVLCVFAFASCDKKGKKDATTAAPATVDTSVTTAATTEAEPTLPPHVHTPESEFFIETEPTCRSTGLKYKFCSECGAQIDETIEEIPINPDAHVVDEWVTDAPTLLDPTGFRTGTCSNCGKKVDQELTFEHDVKILTTSGGKYSKNYATLGEIRGAEHFYATDEHPDGNDLLVEFSFLWNESLLNLYNTGNAMPAIDTRFVPNQSGSNGNMGIVRLELATGTESRWCICKFGGGFTAYGSPEPDCPYPRFENTVDDETAYPNIGGANKGDGQPLGDTQWGWHRVSIRFREELTNPTEVKGGAEATYYIQLWVYIDGDLVFHNSGTDHRWGNDNSDRKLFSAASDGQGGIEYTENDNLYLHGAFLDSTKMKDGKGYFEIADYSATIGSDFVQNVRKVTNPVATTLDVDEGVTVPSTMWYELDD